MKFFSSILKQKKITVFALLFLAIVGVVVPHITIAASWNPACWSVWGEPTAGTYWGDYCYYAESNNQKALETINNTLDSAIKPIFNGFILAAGMIMVIISGTLSSMAAGLLSWVTSPDFFKISYTGFDNPAIAAGWPMVRDLANMFVVLGFVIIGIATTLRIESYQAKKTLAPLIIAALLINFSLLICGIFIDGSNITTKYFLQSGGFMQKELTTAIGDQVASFWQNYKSGEITTVLGTATGLVFYNTMAFVIFMLFFFLFLARYMALWTLVILSPLAFVSYVFPRTKKFADMWVSQFIQWCIIGIPAGFFLWVADKITVELVKNPAGPANGSPSLGAYLIPGVFLIVGFLASLQVSAMGSGVAINAFKGTGKFAGNAINKSRLGEATRGAKNLAARVGAGTLERVGLAPIGTKSKMNATAVDKAHKDRKMDSHTDAEILKEMDSRGATGVAAFKEATKRKIVNQYAKGKTDQAAQISNLARRAEGYGVNRGDVEKLMPELAQHNTKRVAELRKTVNPTTGVDYTKPQAEREAERERNSRLGVSNLRDMAPQQLNKNVAEDISSSTMARARLEMTSEQKAQWRDNADAHLRGLRSAILPATIPGPGGALIPVQPTDPTHPRHKEYTELANKILELNRA